jgi:RHS repeat-associated protein
LEAQKWNSATQADRDYVTAARNQANTLRGLAVPYQQYATNAQGLADKYEKYADFFIEIESDPYLQTTHWQTLAQARHDGLAARATALDSLADSYSATAGSYTSQANTQQGNADTRYAQIMASAQAQRNQLAQQTQTAKGQAAIAQAAAAAAAVNVTRLQTQLAMLQTNSSDTGHITWWRADTVDAEGRISQEVLGNGLITRRTYDPANGHLLEIKTGGAGISSTDNDLQDVGYSYDDADNVQYRWDHNINVDTDYQYDNLDRLTSVRSVHPTNATLNWTIGYTYDYSGNFTGVNHAGTPITYTYDTLTRSTSDGVLATNQKRLTNVSNVGNITYDANGNVLTSGNRSITWDANNYPLTMTNGAASAAYTYGPGRNRLTKVETRGGLDWKGIYAQGYERSTITGGWFTKMVENRYPIIVNGRLVATRLLLEWPNSANNGTESTWTRRAEYYHEDALNNVELVTDSIGRIMKRFYYDPFGLRYDMTAQGLDNSALVRQDPFFTFVQQGFSGHEHLDELGLIHMNGRVYDTYTRRFLSADPNIQAPYETQSYNRYSYVKNNPLKYTDPSGFFFKKLFKKIKHFVKAYWRPLLAIAVAIVTYGAASGWAAGWGLGGFGSAVVGGAVSGFAAGAISTGTLRGAFTGALTGAIFGGVQGYFGPTWNLSRVGVNTLAGGVSSELSGGRFMDGLRMSLAVSALSYANYSMRQSMIEQTDGTVNGDGKSAGYGGDGKKLAGAREVLDNNGERLDCTSPMGGCQGAPKNFKVDQRSNFFGTRYSPGDARDIINESFAGPHDWLRNATGSYLPNGNGVFLDTPMTKVWDEIKNYSLVAVASPMGMGGLAGTVPGVGALLYTKQ